MEIFATASCPENAAGHGMGMEFEALEQREPKQCLVMAQYGKLNVLRVACEKCGRSGFAINCNA